MAVHVLLVEDDDLIGQALVPALGDEGFDVHRVASGEDALGHLRSAPTDLVLLDLMLPGMDGLAVCETLRAQGDLPIIVVTARTASEDVIAGLEAGADDYVTKPVIARELAARIRALLRRRGPGRGDVLHAGELEIRPQKNEVLRAGIPVHLTRTEFRLLVALATAQGDVVTREELLHRIWGYDYFGDTRLLDVHVRRLRRKIEPDPDRPEVVLTVRGAGYRIAPGR
ncbi:DNA-binding response OmpR family regulator [Amycolatopsis bartoniae]|uniref:DNA-binding response regulator n=1 Tax=Amycolatopsis bartoniae TaxID=941986 RepID=A0A8H9IRF8_9PSEU|nr:response regulator transcription factor [Amycolatopsis bartoniae]MBB2938057.1 DNA-binding response OmpR family regulator [Amycolatopsis bartoniae]TVT09934.1 response regulator transcription factor [Amycolatopsis bartoniae]GHF32390.1 DNA-binding response regulator [Amycolatopsis bartoniae]